MEKLLHAFVNTFVDEPVLIGTWRIKCPYCNQIDTVDGATKQHPCSKCNHQTRVNGGFYIVCPNPACQQADHVTNFTAKHYCSVCGSSKDEIKPIRKANTAPVSHPRTVQATHPQHSNGQLQIDFAQIQLGREIGSGNFGVICEASMNGQPIAVKRLKLHEADKAQMITETRALQQLRHECIVCLKGVTKEPITGETMIVMEYMPDGSLEDLISTDRAHLSRDTLLQIALDVAEGLRYLHSQRVIHRDLKPANVLLYDKKKRAKISDFGTAKIFDKSTKASTVVGTMGFMAPEVLQELPYTNKIDIYSFGVLLYQMLTTRPLPVLFSEEARTAKIRSEVHDPDLQALIIDCCKMEANERPAIETCIEKLRCLRLNYGGQVNQS